MKALALLYIVLLSTGSYSQKPSSDTWSNVPKASDDRFTNPKSAIYAGPNGWWNFGEVRAEGTTSPTLKYGFKGGLTTNQNVFHLSESGKLQVLTINFGTAEPSTGTYQVADKPDYSNKKVALSFSDVAD